MADTLRLNRDQLNKFCQGDQDMIRKFEQSFLGIEQIPALEDGVDGNTLAISTLSDLVRPITINLIEPLSAQVSANTTYTLSGGEATEGMKTIFIPDSFLTASAAGPFTLTITTGSGDTVLVPISPSTNTISSGNLMFDIHVDAAGNVSGKSWEIRGLLGSALYTQSHTGAMSASVSLNSGANVQVWTFPYPFSATPPGIEVTANPTVAHFAAYQNPSATSIDTICFSVAGAAQPDPRSAFVHGTWRT